jgi:hypothetical protein
VTPPARPAVARPAGPARLAGGLGRLLPAWFAAWSAQRVWALGSTGSGWDWSFLGRDFWIYRNAGRAVLDGTSPWEASSTWNGLAWHYAAPPTAAQLFVPFAILPETVGLVLFTILSLSIAWLGLRRIGLAAWWLLFPPMAEGLVAANPQVLLIGVLLLGGPWAASTPAARAIAVGLKSYAIAPVVARREWRALVGVAAMLGVSIALGPALWAHYLAEMGTISGRLVEEAQGGVSATVVLTPGALGRLAGDGPAAAIVPWLILGILGLILVLVAMRDVTTAGWLAVPLLLPGAEYHLGTMAIPIARRLSIWLIAVPTIPTYLVGLIVLAWEATADRPTFADAAIAVPLPAWLRSLRAPAASQPAA